MASDSGQAATCTSQQVAGDCLDLDAIIEQLSEIESQLSSRGSEFRDTSDASQIAERSLQFDRELSNVLEELSNLESSAVRPNNSSGNISTERHSPDLDDGEISHSSSLSFCSGKPSVPISESNNSFGALSSQSSSPSNAAEELEKAAQTLVRVYSTDGGCKTVAVDERTTVGKVCEVLAKKNHVALPLNWAIVEHLPDLHMERILEDHLFVVDQLNLWTKDSRNRLVFVERPEKYSIFNDPELKDAAAKGSFVPAVDGFLHFKLDGKKTWKKIYFVLRASGLYCNPKGKGKGASDLIRVQTLTGFDFYFGFDWKKYYKSPTEFGFALKMPMVQKEVPKFVRFFCVEDRKILMDWVTAFRLVKHGCQLHDSFVQAQSWIMTESYTLNPKVKSPYLLLAGHQRSRSQDASIGSFLLDDKVQSDTESDVVFTHSRKNSTESGTPKKSIPNLPITTSITRQLSVQNQNLARTPPQSLACSVVPGLKEDSLPNQPPGGGGDLTKFPSPKLSLFRKRTGNGAFDSSSSTLPRRWPRRALLDAMQAERSGTTLEKYRTLNARLLREYGGSPVVGLADRNRTGATVSHSQSSVCGFSSQQSHYAQLCFSKSLPSRMSSSSDAVLDGHDYMTLTREMTDCRDLPPPPLLPTTPLGDTDDFAFDQNLPLPPPPPELTPGNCTAASSSSPYLLRQVDSSFPAVGDRPEGYPPASSPRLPKSSPPVPPARSVETKLSACAVDPRAQHIIHDLDRVMTQKHERGADGLTNLEVPPPYPSSSDEGYEDLGSCDFPPPPAEILESLKTLMRNRPLPPIPLPLSRPMFSKLI